MTPEMWLITGLALLAVGYFIQSKALFGAATDYIALPVGLLGGFACAIAFAAVLTR